MMMTTNQIATPRTTPTARRKGSLRSSSRASSSSSSLCCSWLLLLLAVLSSSPSSSKPFLSAASVADATSTWSEDEESVTQYILPKFGVRLSPTPTGMEASDFAIQTTLRDVLESTIFDYIESENPDQFEYIWLLGIESVSWTTMPTRNRMLLLVVQEEQEDSRSLQNDAITTVVLEGAAISFDSPVNTDTIDGWVQAAIQTDLVNNLKAGSDSSSSPYQQVTTADYVSFAVVPTPAPVVDDTSLQGEETTTTVDSANVSDFDTTPEGKAGGKIAGSIVGVVLVVVGVGLLVKKKRQQDAASNEIMRDLEQLEHGALDGHVSAGKPATEAATVVEEDFMADTGAYYQDADADEYDDTHSDVVSHRTAYGSHASGGGAANNNHNNSSTGAAFDTVSVVSEFTMADDASRVSNPNNSSSSRAVYAETFDRQTRLQKDMLQGEWSVPPTTSNATGIIIGGSMDSSSSNSSGGEMVTTKSGMSFEKAYDDPKGDDSGEEVYLMSHSRKGGTRAPC